MTIGIVRGYNQFYIKTKGDDEESSRFWNTSASWGWCEPDASKKTVKITSELSRQTVTSSLERNPSVIGNHIIPNTGKFWNVCCNRWFCEFMNLVLLQDEVFLFYDTKSVATKSIPPMEEKSLS